MASHAAGSPENQNPPRLSDVTTLASGSPSGSPRSSYGSESDLKKPAYPQGEEAGTTPRSSSRFNPRTWSRKTRIIAIIALILLVIAIIIAIAVPLALKSHHSSEFHTHLLAEGTPLRIMPLGASITYGWLSTDGNGYRKDLLSLLDQGGNVNATYVGSRHNGTMTNNAVEGWSGYRIDQVLAKANASVPKYLPNVILVEAGTNDCVQDFDIDSTTETSRVEPSLTSNETYTVGDRMRIMLDDLLAWSPNTTVVLSTLIINLDAAVQSRVDDANKQFRQVIKDMQDQGLSVVLADMDASAGGPKKSTMSDSTHPDDAGYARMAKRWYVALEEASKKGIIVDPE